MRIWTFVSVKPTSMTAIALCVCASLATAGDGTQGSGPQQHVARLRYPAGIALADHGHLLLTANQRSGTVSIVDLTQARVRAEIPVGKSLSAIASIGDGDHFLVTDFAGHGLHLMAYRNGELKRITSLGVSPYPASVVADKDGRRCFVASLWSRKLTIVDIVHEASQAVRLKVAKTISLPFPPRLQLLDSDGRILVVADAFGGNLAVVQVPQALAVKSIPGHNIRGLAWSTDGKRLLVSHQTLNRLAYTSPEDVHWGSVVSNVLRFLDRDALESPGKDVLAGSDLLQLGDVGNGAGDPASLAVAKDGAVFVALAGVGEVAAVGPGLADVHRVHVGTRPTALMLNSDGIRALRGRHIRRRHHDCFPIAPGEKTPIRISLGPQPELSAAERGERLFFDAHLSHDNWMSCHSCHTDGHSSDGLADTLGDGSFGAPKSHSAPGWRR